MEALDQTLQDLTKQVQYLNFLIDNMNELFYTFDMEGIITSANKKAIQTLGYECGDDIIGRSIFEFLNRDDMNLTKEQVFEKLGQGMNGTFLLPIVCKNGDSISLRLNSSLIIEDEKVVGALVVAEDITESRKTKAALRQSEERFRDLFDNATDIIFLVDLNGIVMSINNACETVIGYSPQEIIGKNLYSLIVPEHIDMAQSNLEDIIMTGTRSTSELAVIAKNGTRMELEVNARLMYQDKVPYAIQGMIRDITERKQTEEKLRFLGLYDSLTGLHNRAYFTEEMRRVENGRFDPVGLIVCDLDGLKLVNDNMGHDAGDALLLVAANIMRLCFRQSDVVSRIGGDEFAVLVPNSSEENVEEAANRIRRAVRSYNLNDPPVPLSMSVGCATRHSFSTSINELFKTADNRMYQEKIGKRENLRRSAFKDLWDRTSQLSPLIDGSKTDL